MNIKESVTAFSYPLTPSLELFADARLLLMSLRIQRPSAEALLSYAFIKQTKDLNKPPAALIARLEAVTKVAEETGGAVSPRPTEDLITVLHGARSSLRTTL